MPVQVVARASQLCTRGSIRLTSSSAISSAISFGVVLDGGQRERCVWPVQRAQVAAAGKHTGQWRVDGVDHDPVLAAAVAAQFDFM